MKHLKFIKIFIFFFLITIGCNNTKDEFISLDQLTFTNDYYKDSMNISYYILIDHPNTAKDSLKYNIINYVKARLERENLLEQKNMASINFVFYKKTKNTSYFIKNKEDPGGFSSEEISHYQEDYIANYSVIKCNNGSIEKIYIYDIQEEIIINNCKSNTDKLELMK